MRKVTKCVNWIHNANKLVHILSPVSNNSVFARSSPISDSGLTRVPSTRSDTVVTLSSNPFFLRSAAAFIRSSEPVSLITMDPALGFLWIYYAIWKKKRNNYISWLIHIRCNINQSIACNVWIVKRKRKRSKKKLDAKQKVWVKNFSFHSQNLCNSEINFFHSSFIRFNGY